MLSHDLKDRLAPFKLLISRSALNPIYRAIEIGPDEIRACTSWGILEVGVELGFSDTLHVDRAAFLAIVQSLPKGHQMVLSRDETSLLWSCGNARGKLALMPEISMPWIEWPQTDLLPFPIELAKAMELGSIACHTTALTALGMFGIVFDQREGLAVSSTDNTSLSTGLLQSPLLPALPDISTLPPDGVELLYTIMKKGALLGSDEKAWYYVDAVTRCKIGLLPAMKSDIQSVRAKYTSEEIVVPIPHEALDRFIKRANALAEIKRGATVRFSIVNGYLQVSFKEGTSTTDEFFLIEQSAVPDMPEIILSASKTARALAHVQWVVLDHVDRSVLLFRGHAPEFDYLLCGKLASDERR